jgi:hypothetical protein
MDPISISAIVCTAVVLISFFATVYYYHIMFIKNKPSCKLIVIDGDMTIVY